MPKSLEEDGFVFYFSAMKVMNLVIPMYEKEMG